MKRMNMNMQIGYIERARLRPVVDVDVFRWGVRPR